jgi:hypothetical protein
MKSTRKVPRTMGAKVIYICTYSVFPRFSARV